MKKIFLFYVLYSFFCSTSFSQTFPAGFSTTDIGSGWVSPTGSVFTPDGQKIFVWEKRGHVYVSNRNISGVYIKQTTPVINIEEEVGNWRDFGLLGFAIDPNFASNGYIYLLYVVDRHHLLYFGTPTYNPATNTYFNATIGRITRYQTSTIAGNLVANTATRTILLGETKQTGIAILHESHGTGALEFAEDGTLLASTGDGASYASTDGGSRSETYYSQALADGIIRTEENVGAFRAQMLNSHNGKLLRINPANGDGIPSNPFYDPTAPRSAKSRVWALGLRNPFRFTIKPGTGSTNPEDGHIGEIFVSDVGWNTWEDLHIIHDEGTNCGWPLYEGLTQMTSYFNLTTQNLDEPNPLYNGTTCARPYFRFKELLKQATADNIKTVYNPCNASVEIGTGNRYIHLRPSLDWHHTANNARVGTFTGNNSSEATIGTPQSGVTGTPFKGNAAVTGCWYTGTTYPANYRNTYFQADYGGDWLKSFKVDFTDKVQQVQDFGTGFAAIVSVTQNPLDGKLVYVDYALNLVRAINYGGNQLPVVVMSSDKIFGASPLDVAFNSVGSFDPDGTIVSRSWDFGDGSPVSSITNPTHIFTALPATPTKYVVKLTVTDNSGGTSTDSIIISINNTPPVVNITSPVNNSFYTPGPDTIYSLTAIVTDAEHSPSQLKYSWQTILRHNIHQHPEPIDTNKNTTSTISRIGCSGENYYWEFRLTVTDAAGLSTSDTSFIYPGVTPSVSITANPGNSICSGTQVTFTTTPTNGGPTPSYQWKLNGINVGTNSNQYQNSGLTNSDIVICVLTSNADCASPITANSNTITMLENPIVIPSLSIAANPGNSICSGTLVTFTATPTNGGSTPSYQWKLNGNNAGTNSNQFQSSGLINGDIVTCVLTSNANCASPSTATSNAISMVVTTIVTPSVSISVNPGNSICSGTLVTFTATPTNGGSTPSYQWKLNGNNVGTNSNQYQNSVLTNGAIVTCVLTSNANCASTATATSNAITMAVTTTVTPSVSITANPGNTICSGTLVTFTATSTNGGAIPSYQWKLNGNNVGTNSNQYQNSVLTNGAIVTCVLTSNANCASPTTVTSNAITMAVTTTITPSVSIAANPGNTICSGIQVTFTATPTNGGSTPSYQWKLNGNNVGTNSNQYQNSSLVNSDIVTCILTSNVNCASSTTATSNAITMTVNAIVTPSVSIVANPGNSICSGVQVTFTTTPINGGTTPSYQWKLNGNNVGTNSNQYQNSALNNGDIVTCVLTSNANCASPATATSNAITMAVSPTVTPSVSIAANPGNTICSGTQVTFIATPTNGGSTPSYQWKLNGNDVGTNSNQYQNSGLVNGDIITCVLTSSLACGSPTTSTSNAITMAVSASVTPSLIIAANPGNSICSGTQVTFTATPTNGGPTSSYQWKLNGNNVGTNSNQYQNTSLVNSDIVSCELTSSLSCANPTTSTSNAINMSVTVSVTPSVSIAAIPGNTICSGTQVTFTATPTNGGTTPSYQWKLNGNNVGTNSNQYQSSGLVNSDIVTCVLTSNANCASPATATSNAIAMVVTTTVTPNVSIAANPGNAICSGTQVTFTATPTNGGSTPSYQWKLNGNNIGTNNVQYQNSGLLNGDIVTCVLTSNANCVSPATATSNAITMAVTTTVTPSVSIAPDPGNTICSGTQVTFTATPTNGGSIPTYQWKLNGNNVGTNSYQYQSSSLLNGDIITCVLTSNANCASPATATSNAITMAVTTIVTPSVSIAANPGSTICSGMQVTFIATPTNGGSTPSYQWKLNGNNVGANSNQYQSSALVNSDIVSCVLTSNINCASSITATSNAITMTVNAIITPSVSIAVNPGNTICSGIQVTFTATPTNGGSTPSYQWKLNGNNVGTNSIQYQNSALNNGDIVTCVLTSNANCVSPATATSNSITMTVNAIVTPSVSIAANPGNTICSGIQVIFTATPTNGGSTPSYQWKLNGNNTGTNSNQYQNSALTNGDIVTCVLTSNANCASPTTVTSNTITMTVIALVTPSVSIVANPGNSICSGSLVIFVATPTNGGPTPSYQWKLNGNNVGTNSNQYQNTGLMNSDIVSCELTSSLACAKPTTSTSNVINMSVTVSVTPSVSIAAIPGNTICSGTQVIFTATPTNGGTTPSYQWKLNGNDVGTNSNQYQNSGLVNNDIVSCVLTSNASCTNPSIVTSNIISMSVIAIVTPSVSIVANPGNNICSGTQVTFIATPTNGGFGPYYQWKLNGNNVGTNSNQYQNSFLTNGDIVTCVLTSSLACATPTTSASNAITMAVATIVTPSVNIAANPGNSICSGTQVKFTATPTNGGSTPFYQWKLNGNNVGTNSNQYQNSSLVNSDKITCILTSSLACANPTTSVSNTITMSVLALIIPTVNIAVNPGNKICSGTQVTFTATSTNGGSSPSYQWKLNGNNVGTNSNQYQNSGLANGAIVTCLLTSNANCASPTTATSNAITIAVTTTVTPSVNIIADPGNTICSGTQVTFTATAINGGSTPTYQWKLNGINVGTNSNQYQNSGLTNGAIVICVLTSNANCTSPSTATSNTITMAVTTIVTPSVSIAANPGNTICSGTQVTFTSTPTNGGSTPSYQWKLNGINVGTNINQYQNSGLVNGDIVTCELTSNVNCSSSTKATSNSIIMAVTTIVTPSISIVANPGNSICSGTQVTFTATPINGGPNPTYQWKLNGNNVGTNSNQYQSSGLLNGDMVTCVLTSSIVCISTASATSNTLTISLNVAPLISTQPGSQTVNEGSGVNFNVVASGSGLSYQWRKGGQNIPSASNSSFSIANVTAIDAGIYDVVVSGYCIPVITSNVATLTVNAITTQPANKTVCLGASTSFNVVATGTALTYQWQISIGGSSFADLAGATTSTLNLNSATILLNGNKYRCIVNGSLISNAGILTVVSLPVVSLTLPFDTLYQNSPIQVLTGGNPSGGVYSGIGISAGSFNPATNQQENYSVNYQFTNANGCTSNATDVFTIIAQIIEVNLYPNPAVNGMITIVSSPFLVGSNVTAFNAFGQKITEWNLGGRRTSYSFKWPVGNYILYFKKGNAMVSKKFIIIR